jgi:hypothetical protein
MAQLTGDEKKKFLRDKLEDQRRFMEKSIRDFAAGDIAEAVRLAVAMRVLVHETSNSKALLAQLTANYLQLEILDRKPPSTPKRPPGHGVAVVLYVPVSFTLSQEGVRLDATLKPENYIVSILGRWWTRQSLLLPGLGGFSRKEIILGLVDKEGGAHVDLNLSPRYKQLLASQQLAIGCAGQTVTPLNLSRFMAAQAAVELLDCLDKNLPRAGGILASHVAQS